MLTLVQHAADEDGVSPLSEHVLLHLRYGGDQRARNLLSGRTGGWPGTGTWTPLIRWRDRPRDGGGPGGAPPGRRNGPRAGDQRRGGRWWAPVVGARRVARGGPARGGSRVHQDQGAVADAPLAANQDRPAADRRRDHGARVRAGAGRGRMGRAEPPRLRAPSGAGRLDPRGPDAARTRAMVRPGRVLPGRARQRPGRFPLDQDPRRRAGSGRRARAAGEPERTGTGRSARSTWSASTRPSAVPASAER